MGRRPFNNHRPARRHGYIPGQHQVTMRAMPGALRSQLLTDGKASAQEILQTLHPKLATPLMTALQHFEAGELGKALHWFGEAAKIDAQYPAPDKKPNKAMLYFGAEAAQRAYFLLKHADPQPPTSHLARWRQSAMDLSNALVEAHPDSTVIHNMARFIQDDGDDAASVPLYLDALKRKRDQVESWGNLGTAYFRMGLRAEADRAWGKCVAFDAQNASGSMAQGYIWIRRGEWKKGWEALNRRWLDRTFTDTYGRKDLNAKGQAWMGEPLPDNASLLLHGEQGLGDHVMFARYAPLLAEKGIRIAALETRQALKGWFDACWLGCPVIIRDMDPLPAFTHHVPLMSLPGILGLTEIPPPLAPAMPDPAPRSGRKRVGLVWKGSRGNIMDAQRSIPDECLVALNGLDVDWVPLMHDPNGEHLLTAQMWLDNVVEPPDFRDVLGLAEAMRTCDHVLTVDTLHAHVAGSLGVPSTVVHRYHREWRWGIDTETAPWYANQRLVTCPTPDAWESALTEAVQFLKQHAPAAEGETQTGTAELGNTTPPTFGFPTVTVKSRYGPMVVNPHDQFVGRSLIEYGEFSKGEGDLFAALVQPHMHVIEVGANIGAHTRLLTHLAASVTAYEPHPHNAAMLRANAPNAVVVQSAVGKQSGETTIDAPDYRTPGNFGGLRVGRGGIAVPMTTLDANHTAAHFIKLDCEGMELDVLQGGLGLLVTQPVLYAEADRKSTAEPLIAFLHGLGYECWWHLPPMYAPDNYNASAVNVFGGVMSVNILAVPKDRPCPVDRVAHRLLPVQSTRIELQP